MTRGNRASCERRSTGVTELERNDSENDGYVKRPSTSMQKRWTSSEDLSGRPHSRKIKTVERSDKTINKKKRIFCHNTELSSTYQSSLREQNSSEDIGTESSDIKDNDKPHRTNEHLRGKTRYSDTHENAEKITSKYLGERRKKRSKRIERRKLEELSRVVKDDYRDRIDRVGSSFLRRYNTEDGLANKSQRKKNTARAYDEMPIAEILKKAQESAHTKYEEPVPLPELTTNTIYIQGRNGFSAVKIGGLRRALGSNTCATKDIIVDREGDCDSVKKHGTHTLIKVAITAQKFWKCTGLVFQGLLGGMALLHFVMLHVFFDTSLEFLLKYSIFSEVYTNMFSFLITSCVISIFDKFDLTRLDADHLHELYTDHTRSAIAVPLYLITFALHQASSKIDDQLALMRYCNVNETTWLNNTMLKDFSDELNGWEKIIMTKDLLAVLAWLFVILGTRDNMLLTHLKSMEKYANDTQNFQDDSRRSTFATERY